MIISGFNHEQDHAFVYLYVQAMKRFAVQKKGMGG